MERDIVLVRGAGGRPHRMVAVSIEEHLVYVANPDTIDRVESGESWPVGVLGEDVFVYRAEAFDELARIWNSAGTVDRMDWRRHALKLYSVGGQKNKAA